VRTKGPLTCATPDGRACAPEGADDDKDGRSGADLELADEAVSEELDDRAEGFSLVSSSMRN
jgi:hypothetical protein